MDANGNLIYRGQQSGFTLVVLDPNTFSADFIAPVKLSLYPNPATHSFQFDPEFSLDRSATAQLLDLTGRVVRKFQSDELMRQVIDVADIPRGIYFFLIENNGKVIQQKLVLN
jgi:hypothetical protein